MKNSLHTDPLKLKDLLWPHVTFYDKQIEVIYSVWNNDETIVPAGNMLGKDFVAGFIVIAAFLTRTPCRIVTTSVKGEHLDVLWGEIGRYIDEAEYSLDSRKGGPLIVNHHLLRKIVGGKLCKLSYVKGMVASDETKDAFGGHHIAKVGDGVWRTMLVGDEASGLKNSWLERAEKWRERLFLFGNPWECPLNYFRESVEGKPGGTPGGDIFAPDGHCERKVIRIRAEDSPNVKYGLAQKARKKTPTDEMVIPGVLSYREYCKRRRRYDPIQQCVSLDARWYKGPSVDMFPEEWLRAAEERATRLKKRTAKTMGVDSAMGADNTAWAVGDELGLIDLVSEKTPDTSSIPGTTLALMRLHGLMYNPQGVLFDYGGGGKPHVDRLRRQGYNVRAINFGASATAEKRRGITPLEKRKQADEIRVAFKNRRAEMYYLFRERLDPSFHTPYAIPSELLHKPRPDGGPSLFQQLRVVPLYYDEEGRVYLPPKRAKSDDPKGEDRDTMSKRTGCSPDEADAVVLQVYGIARTTFKATAGVMM